MSTATADYERKLKRMAGQLARAREQLALQDEKLALARRRARESEHRATRPQSATKRRSRTPGRFSMPSCAACSAPVSVFSCHLTVDRGFIQDILQLHKDPAAVIIP